MVEDQSENDAKERLEAGNANATDTIIDTDEAQNLDSNTSDEGATAESSPFRNYGRTPTPPPITTEESDEKANAVIDDYELPASPSKRIKVVTGKGIAINENHNAKLIIGFAREALNDCGGVALLTRYLNGKIEVLMRTATPLQRGQLAGGQPVRDIIVSNWVEELLRFLVIKTVAGDVSLPCELVPSAPVDEAWRGLLTMPSAYAKVCNSMGSAGVIDRDPTIDDDDAADDKMRKKHFNSTIRVYHHCFEVEPSHLFWPDPTMNDPSPVNQNTSNPVCDTHIVMKTLQTAFAKAKSTSEYVAKSTGAYVSATSAPHVSKMFQGCN